MVIGMATTKITITLPDDQLKKVKVLVASGSAKNISAFVKHAVDVAIQDAAGWRATLDEALEQTGGPLTDKERAWVDSLLLKRPGKGRAGRRKAA
jgi:Arc/MetJ-type ribon-helix-helix transcriptional regulator